jgi:crotonobetainyl-CoA:carnitine CoA-transferase CaiB-like acyl-CoA transferase
MRPIPGSASAGPTATTDGHDDPGRLGDHDAGIVTTLYDRDRSGEGRLVEVAMQETVWPTLAASYDYYYRTGEIPPRTGNRQSGLNSAPYNVLRPPTGTSRSIS